MKKCIVSLILILSMLLPLSAADGVAYLEGMKSLQPGSIGGDWAVIALARSGGSDGLIDSYYLAALDTVAACKGVLHATRMTEYSRVSLAIAAIGRDPTNVGGYDITAPLYQTETVAKQGVNSISWALTLLDCGIPLPEADDVREYYVAALLEKQASDGSICDLPGSEAEYTAMAIRALSKYRERAEVDAAIEDGLAFLRSVWDPDGGFPSRWGESSEPISQAIVALCTLGLHPDDGGFDGISLLDELASYRQSDGSYAHTKGGKSNQMATEQAALAHLAVERLKDGKCPLFDFSDVKTDTSAVTRQIGLPGKSADVHPPEIVSPGVTFSDFYEESSARKSAAEALASRGIITGYEDGTFRPDIPLTRAQFAALIVRALGLSHTASSATFADVTAGAWYFTAVETAHHFRIVSGVSAREFNPEGTVKMEEAATMLARAAKLCGCDTMRGDTQIRNTLSVFGDYTKAADYARAPLAFCVDEGILDGDALNLRPKDAVTRGEAAIMIHALLAAAKLI